MTFEQLRRANVRDFGAMGTGDVDDAPAIQRAINALDPAGGIVFIPAGTYRIGTPATEVPSTNAPLFVGSRIHLVGEGSGRTILRLANDVQQTAATGLFPGRVASLIMNKSNGWWYGRWSAGVALAPDEDIVVAGMTLDGNKDGQTTLYVPGSRTMGAVVDPVGSVSGIGSVSASAPAVEHPAHVWVSVSYVAADGAETGALQSDAIPLAPEHNAVELTLPDTPTGATAIRVYMASEQDEATNLRYRRLADPLSLPDTDRKRIVPLAAWLGPPEPAPEAQPPGTWLLPIADSAGLHFTEVRGCRLRDVEIKDFIYDGLTLQSLDATDQIHAEGLWIHGNRRQGITLDGPGRDLVFINCKFEDNNVAADICEAGQSLIDLSFIDCTFRNNGVVIGPGSPYTIDGVKFIACVFEGPHWLMTGILFPQGKAGFLRNVLISGCRFEGLKGPAVVVGMRGTGRIEHCNFLANGFHPRAQIAQLLFQDPVGGPCAWFIEGNRFVPPDEPRFDHWPVIEVAGQHQYVVVRTNVLESTPSVPVPYLMQRDDSPEANHRVDANVASGGGLLERA